MSELVPSSLITSYHYLRYILLGFFLFVSHKYMELCSSGRLVNVPDSTATRVLLLLVYVAVGLTLLAADIRNYVLYKLLYHKFYECTSGRREELVGNIEILESMMERRGIVEEQQASVACMSALARRIKSGARGPWKYAVKIWFNWRMFWAVQPGPVSACIILLYIVSIVLVGYCSLH